MLEIQRFHRRRELVFMKQKERVWIAVSFYVLSLSPQTPNTQASNLTAWSRITRSFFPNNSSRKRKFTLIFPTKFIKRYVFINSWQLAKLTSCEGKIYLKLLN